MYFLIFAVDIVAMNYSSQSTKYFLPEEINIFTRLLKYGN